MKQGEITFHHSTQLPRLVVSDLDGTLLNPQHTISRRTIETLSNAQNYHLSSSTDTGNNQKNDRQPIHIMIASGRSPRSIQKVIDLFEGLMIPDAVICCNGALNYNPRTKLISHPQFMPLDHSLVMVQQLRNEIQDYGTLRSKIPPSKVTDPYLMVYDNDLKPLVDSDTDNEDQLMAGRSGFACEVIWILGTDESGDPIYAQDTSFVCDRTWELQRKHSLYYEYTVVDTMEEFIQSLQIARKDGKVGPRGGILKLMALDRNRAAPEVYYSLPERFRAEPLAGQKAKDLSSPLLSVTYSGNYFLEMSAPGVNKGLGLEKYCEANQIPREHVVAFGDLLNDAEMLKFAGLGLCMGNGHEAMKSLADRVIGTNVEDGVAKEIELWFT
ncbi:hypothetical protein BGZ76_010083 [Entomortierella beljakovae]|nr:hypothetical protein BGZ76_010083 [Entomortierella beljakovae]